MRLVRRYPLALQREQVVTLPKGTHPLHFAVLADVPYIWAMVNPAAETVHCLIRMFATGEEFEEWSEQNTDGFRGDYIGTALLSDGREFHFVMRVK